MTIGMVKIFAFLELGVGQKIRDLRLAQLGRMALVVEQDKAADPADVGPLGQWTVMAGGDGSADLFQQTGFSRGG